MNCKGNSCPKSGIKIQSTNNYTHKASQLTTPVNFQNTPLNSLDLDLDHYSLEDLNHLFNIKNGILDELSLKNAKQITLKMHPDKSHLDQKYFLFFSKAYKRLFGIYEFQNKSSVRKTNTNTAYVGKEFFDESNTNTLQQMFKTNKHFEDPKNFNSWFNDTFEKHRLDNPIEQGYGDWLKTDEGIMNINDNVTKGNMNEIFERQKKQVQAITAYTGVTDMVASTFGGSLLNGNDNFTGDNYTDLRQAYTETLIPVTNDDFEKMAKFKNISEYKAHRDQVDITPITEEEGNKILYNQQQRMDQESSALAFKYAKEAEISKQKQQSFWGDIRRLTNF